MTAPWDVQGLPCGLTEEDFEVALHVLMTGLQQDLERGRLMPLMGGPVPIRCKLYGGQYERTSQRQADLQSRKAMYVNTAGFSFHPAILVPDPTESDAEPVGVASISGFVGSAFSAPEGLAKEVANRARGGRFYVSRVHLTPPDENLELRVVLPVGFEAD